jgi:vacuolar-type H+-ATPase subunit E/Vma4
MAYQELLQSMELSAEEKVQNLLEIARKTGESILSEARKEAEANRRNLVAEAREEVQAERNHALYVLREELKAEMALQKQALFDTSFEKAAELLRSSRRDPRYKESYLGLVKDAVKGIPGDQVVIHINPEDSSFVSGFSDQHRSQMIIKPDLTCLGGVNASTPDDRITIHNTFESRLKTAREIMKKEIYSLLFG